jgi:hypothetical protein
LVWITAERRLPVLRPDRPRPHSTVLSVVLKDLNGIQVFGKRLELELPRHGRLGDHPPSMLGFAPPSPLGGTVPPRKGGRVVDCTGLENRQGRKPLVGSNPTPSATEQALVEINRMLRSAEGHPVARPLQAEEEGPAGSMPACTPPFTTSESHRDRLLGRCSGLFAVSCLLVRSCTVAIPARSGQRIFVGARFENSMPEAL